MVNMLIPISRPYKILVQYSGYKKLECCSHQHPFLNPADDNNNNNNNNNNNSVAFDRERTIPIERSPLVGEVSANFCRWSGVAQSAQLIPYCRNLDFLDHKPSR
jgi:hypothetical protein